MTKCEIITTTDCRNCWALFEKCPQGSMLALGALKRSETKKLDPFLFTYPMRLKILIVTVRYVVAGHAQTIIVRLFPLSLTGENPKYFPFYPVDYT